MNPATGAVVTASVVLLGQWSKPNDTVSVRTVVGGAALALGLSLLSEADAELAAKFTDLIVVVAVFMYLPAIAWKLGLLDHKKYPTPPKWIP